MIDLWETRDLLLCRQAVDSAAGMSNRTAWAGSRPRWVTSAAVPKADAVPSPAFRKGAGWEQAGMATHGGHVDADRSRARNPLLIWELVAKWVVCSATV